MSKTTVKKLKTLQCLNTINSTKKKMIHFKERHVFIARDQNLKTELYTVYRFTSEYYS